MMRVDLSSEAAKPLSVLCLGAHSDDIEIGAGGTILTLLSASRSVDVTWCVLSAPGPRRDEALGAAKAFTSGANSTRVEIASFTDGHFPFEGAEIKNWFEILKKSIMPDVIFTHMRADAHQDHRLLNQMTWTTFRDHLILEYEIPKWDGDLGQPNCYVPLSQDVLRRKLDLLHAHFGTQRSKDWFSAETFQALARLRGNECRALESAAEAFISRKMVIC